MLSAALRYAGAGINVFPVSGTKAPLTSHGFHDATTDREQVAAWWTEHPNAGIATADFDAVDVDLYKPECAETWKQIESLIPEGTPQNKTARGGLQFLFRAGSLCRGKIGPGIDSRYAGRNYIILSPSAALGGRYETVVDVLMKRPRPAPSFPLARQSTNGAAPPIEDTIPEGERDDTFTSLGGSMRRRGMNENEILAAFQEINKRAKPPHGDDDLRRIAHSVAGYDPAIEASVNGATVDLEPIEIVTLEDFTAVKEPGAEPLVGNGPDDVLIPEGGDAMVYGDGGSSKTTLGIDLAMHAASGDTWLGNKIIRPLSVLVIENEGPRPLFQTKLERKLQAWTGSPTGGRVHVYRGPWRKLSFADTGKRQQLADAIRDHEIDLVIAGPLTRLGMDEAGTLQQVADFMGLVDNVRELSERRVAILLIHHENKGGSVSGAWEGAGDTLIHAEVHGNGYTKLSFQKARWSSNLHGSDLKLRWTDGEGFEVEETRERDLYDEMPNALREDIENNDPRASGQRTWSPWKTAGELSKLLKANKDACREVADALVERGELKYQEGPKGRVKQAHCWRLRSGSEPPSHPEPLSGFSLG